MPAPQKETLEKLKSILLPGNFPLTHKPILPSLVLFASRPKEFLHELRKLRETLAFHSGPSKKRKTVTRDASEAEGNSDETSDDVSGEKTSKAPTTPRKGRRKATDLSKLNSMSAEDQKMWKELLGG